MSLLQTSRDNIRYSFPAGQKYKCSNCPAKCCRLPWKIAISPEEKAFFESVPDIKRRLNDYSKVFVDNKGQIALPTREKDGTVQCIFLDDDGLCFIQKRHGHEKIPRTCQLFPFDFTKDGSGAIRVSLSHVCPSVRDNYGDPIEECLSAKFGQAKSTASLLPSRINLGDNVLTEEEYLRLGDIWIHFLQKEKDVPNALMKIYGLMTTLEHVLGENPDKSFLEILKNQVETVHLSEGQPVDDQLLIKRVFFGLMVYPFVYPIRVRDKKSIVLTIKTVLQLIRQSGKIDILNLPNVVDLEFLKEVKFDWNKEELNRVIREFLIFLIERGNIFVVQKDLRNIVFSLGVAVCLITAIAKLHTISRGESEVDLTATREGISIAELRLFYHGKLNSDLKVIEQIITLLAHNEPSFGRLVMGR